MKHSRLGRIALLIVAMLNAQACSVIKSWFPDKERDYQFTTEIPELVVPDDLKSKTLATRSLAATNGPVPETRVKATMDQEINKPSKVVKAEPSDVPAGSVPSVHSVPTSGVSSLQIDQTANQAWWTVGKALSRQKLEVVERNMEKGYFFLKYDPDAIKPEDGSILDEITFLFGDDPSQEQEYRVSLHQLEAQLTEVTVQDSEGNTISNSAATSLLRLITEGINQDLPKNSSEKSEQPVGGATAP